MHIWREKPSKVVAKMKPRDQAIQTTQTRPRDSSWERKLTSILLVIYLVLLTWSILFKLATNLDQLVWGSYRQVNLIPFAGSAIVNGHIQLNEIVLNGLAFVPLGLYFQMLWGSRWHFGQKLALVIAISASYEALQYLLGIGATDVTDLLMNTTGGLVGLCLYSILARIFGDGIRRVLVILALIATLLLVLLLGLLIGLNR